MRTVTGTIVAVDHHPGPLAGDWKAYQFHVVVELADEQKVRLRGPCEWSIPLALYQFGERADLDEVRKRLALGAVITFRFCHVPPLHKESPDYHPWDVIVPRPDRITRDYGARRSGQVIDLVQARARHAQRS